MNKLLAVAMTAAVAAATAPAQATVIETGTHIYSTLDPMQFGRLSRNGIPSDWSSVKAYPGELNVSTAFKYFALTINFAPNATQDVYYQISIDDPSVVTFGSAYLGSYDPTDKSLNYIGDAGASGNNFGNPGFFQVKVAAGDTLVLVFNAVSQTIPANGFGYLVEAFQDTDYTDFPTATPGVPEPASWAMMIGGFAIAGAAMRRRARVAFA